MTATADKLKDDSLAEDLFREALRRLASLDLPDRLIRSIPRSQLDDSWHAAVDLGWFRTIVPETDGGLGLGLAELGAVLRAIGHRLLRGPVLDQAITVPLLLRESTGAARDRLLASLDGDVIVVLAENPQPPYGLGPDGIQFVEGHLDGRVALVPFAAHADTFAVVASNNRELWIVLVDAKDTTVTDTGSADPCVEYGAVALNHVPVADSAVIARGRDAVRLRNAVRGTLRLMAVAELSGITEEMTARAVAYAKTRHQFGRPIGGFQAVRHLLAEMHGRTSSLRSLIDACLRDADLDPQRRAELGRVAKAYSAQIARFVAEQSLQVHGGMGFTYEVPLHLYLRRVLTLEGYLGEASDLLTKIGEEETR